MLGILASTRIFWGIVKNKIRGSSDLQAGHIGLSAQHKDLSGRRQGIIRTMSTQSLGPAKHGGNGLSSALARRGNPSQAQRADVSNASDATGAAGRI